MMSKHFPAGAPGFDQPIAVLKHCHDRIRNQLATLEKLLPHLASHGADEQACQGAGAVLNYFEKAAHLHHEDEENDLIPMLQQCAEGDDAALLEQLVPALLADHRKMDAMWQSLHEQLRAIANGSSSVLWGHDVRRFVDAYRAHMESEESVIAPMALRLFDARQMAQLGQAMQVRRGIAEPDPIGISVAALRKDYGQASLSQAEVADDPVTQFASWFAEAIKAEVAEPNAMSLSTVDLRGRPSSRIVLIKQFDPSGFTWYTNYDSDKGRQLAHHPYGALLFFWSELERQIRIEGKVERTTAEESDLYFHSRPLKSRLAAIASAQSMPIASRAELEANYEAIALKYGEQPPRPDNWGGFRLVPERVEFWQGRRSRFHDRIAYTLQEDGSWKRQRLQP